MKRIGPFRGIRSSAGIFSPGQEALARKWIRRCYFFGAAAVCLIGLLECVFYFVVQKLGFLIGGPLTYFLKYILAPCALNAAAVAACAAFLRKVRTLWGKACAVSLMYVFVAFVTYTIHIQFPALAMIYALVIFMTVIYGEWRITTITASAALVSKVLSDLFIVWAPYYSKGRLYDANSVLDFSVSLLVLAAVYGASLMVISFERERYRISSRLEEDRLRLYEETLTDSLTGLRNRNALRLSFDRMVRGGEEGSVFVMLDVDHFKHINDTYGHTVGDQYLQKLSDLLDAVPGAEAFRFGGDEFCLLFREASDDLVKGRCMEVQESFRKSRVCRSHSQTTVSFGAARYEKGLAPSELVRRADKALYQAKVNRGTIKFYEHKK